MRKSSFFEALKSAILNWYATCGNGRAVGRSGGRAFPAAVLPEFVGDQDDPPLQQDGGEHLQQFVNAETLKQTVKVHVFQSGIHWSTQSYDLGSDKGTQHKYSCITNTFIKKKNETDTL